MNPIKFVRSIIEELKMAKFNWIRSFISGSTDPLHNPYMLWCHICKKNIWIGTKGVEEILRNHRFETHPRKDQRWRHEHLRTTNLVTGKVQHRVRQKSVKILTRM